MTDDGSEIKIDRLPEGASSLEVVMLRDAQFGLDAERGPRAPHRHDYHELVWTRSGTGRHAIDGKASDVEPRTITVIGRGQMHVFERGSALEGAIVRFGDELIKGSAAGGPACLIGSRGVQRVSVPAGEVERLDAAIEILSEETRRPRDARSVDLERHLLSALLLWIERWHEMTRNDKREADDPDLHLYRRFVQVLETDYGTHHDAPHYADALRVSQSALSRALVSMTGRSTKELITDRRMLEAARLLRFSELGVGEVAYQAGYDDQLYFSRAFKRHFGEPPSAYRERTRGRGPDR